MKHQLFDQFVREKTVVIMRGLTPEKAQACGDALVKAGIHLMEVPLNRPGALECIKILADHFRGTDVHVGAGTVLKPEQVWAKSIRSAPAKPRRSPKSGASSPAMMK